VSYSVLPAGELSWTSTEGLLHAQLAPGARLQRLRPGQRVAGSGEELYVVLEGDGWIQVGEAAFELPRLSSVRVSADEEREIFNDGDEEALWLVLS
jgi:hypothetical protein